MLDWSTDRDSPDKNCPYSSRLGNGWWVIHWAPFVQRVEPWELLTLDLDNAIHWINFHPAHNAIVSPNTYPLDSDLSSG